jgi:hypothetical protein
MPDTDSLNDGAASLLRRMALVPPREAGDPLRPEDEARILELAAAGQTQTAIAEVIGCHQSTVSRTLAEWADSRGRARQYAEAKALEMMKRFVKDASPADILKMQQKLDVVRDDRAPAATGGVTVFLNTPGNPNNILPVFDREVVRTQIRSGD